MITLNNRYIVMNKIRSLNLNTSFVYKCYKMILSFCIHILLVTASKL